MPFYRFKCSNCDFELKKLLTPAQADAFVGSCQICGTPLVQTLGTPNLNAKETKDEYKGKSVDQDVHTKIDERAKEHWRKHELPRLIEKHGKEYAIRQGWIDEEGNAKR